MSALKKIFDRRRPHPKRSAFSPIGVYLTNDHLHLAQLRRLDDSELAVHCHESLSYPGSRTELLSTVSAIRKLVRRAMRSGDFRGRKVVSAMPSEHVRVMSVSYPASNAGNEVGAITKLMADRVDGSLHDYVMDYVPVRMSSNDGDRLALVAVSRVEHVNAYLTALDSAGLHVDHLEVGPMAVQRLIKWGSTPGNFGNIIVVSVGKTTSKLTTISGRRLLADQEIKFGETTILDEFAMSLGLDRSQAQALIVANGLDRTRRPEGLAETDWDPNIAATLIEIAKPVFLKLVREIERAFLYANSESHGDGSKQLLVTGCIAQWPGAVTLMSALANMEVETLGRNQLPQLNDPDKCVSMDDQTAAEMSVPVGLAMRGFLDDE